MPSIEALAMAGVDCVECGINLEETERRNMEHTPQYLLAEEEPGKKEGEIGDKDNNNNNKLMAENWQVKTKMEACVKAVASNVNTKGRKLFDAGNLARHC
ncbi:conserved hypothetical protein [Ricinus communis]|uniref:Uncharacterized protein n=1 Tax=Ricinus communis TaxID=3988 RepID=B9T3M6_RICCO|nr:conserved hypothetical protein [Ricinus communis]